MNEELPSLSAAFKKIEQVKIERSLAKLQALEEEHEKKRREEFNAYDAVKEMHDYVDNLEKRIEELEWKIEQ